MNTIKYGDPFITQLRSGKSDDPYILKNEPQKVINNRVVLSELPDHFQHVVITGYNEIYSGEPTSTQFIVNYQNGVVTLNSSEEGKTLTLQFFSRGLVQIPSERVYVHTDSQNPDILSNLQEIIDNGQTAIAANSTLAQSISDVNTAITNANKIIDNLSPKGEWNSALLYKKDNIVTKGNATYISVVDNANFDPSIDDGTHWRVVVNVQPAIDAANTAATGANTAATAANTAATSVDTSKANADTATTAANNASTSANAAASSANAAATSANTSKTNADTATNAANTSATNANTAATSANNAASAANAVAVNTVHKGVYAPATTYQPNNVVSYNGASYMCIATSTGILPTDVAKWQLIGQKGDQGIQGNQGIQGPAGVSFTWRNPWNSGISYVVNNVVSYNGSSYICIVNSPAGTLPTDNTKWDIVAQKGVDGAGSVSSVTSINGDITVVNGTTTPALTLNVGTGVNQIVKRNGTGDIPGNITGNAATVTTIPVLSGDVSSIGNAVTLANTGVAVGTYTKVTVDIRGRVTVGASLAATDIPTLTLAKISDAGTAASKNTGIASGNVPILDVNGKIDTNVLPSNVVTSVAGKTGVVTLVSSDVGLGNVTNESKATMFTSPTFTGTPIAPTAAIADSSTQIATTAFVKAQGYMVGNQTITVSGDASGSGTTAISVTLANSGAIAGTYRSVTVDLKGRVTAGTNPTTVGGYGITDAVTNAGNTPSIQSGVDASKPAASTVGRLYITSDTQKIYRDTGAAWALISSMLFADTTSKPTTLSGYGITDAVPSAGGTMTGALTVNASFIATYIKTNSYLDFATITAPTLASGRMWFDGSNIQYSTDGTTWKQVGSGSGASSTHNYQEFTATQGQVLFTLASGSYPIGANSLEVYIDGVRQHPPSYSETSTTSFTLSEGVNVGQKIIAYWYSSVPYNFAAHASTHAPGGGDDISTWYMSKTNGRKNSLRSVFV